MGLALSLLLWSAAPAWSCPASAVLRFVVPFPPGGSYDVLAREIALRLSERPDRQVVVENRSGGNGEVGTTHVAKSAADGCTLVFWGDGILINQATMPARTVDVLRDFAPVTLVARTAQTLVARSGFSAGSLEEVIALSMQPDADVRYGTAGVGTPGHLVMELLNAMSGSRLRHVPYRGGAPALTDVLGGHVDLVSTGLPALIGQIRSGALVPLAVSPLTRTPVLPGVPTFAELIPGVFFDTWYGFLAPAGTPAAVTAGLHADIAAVMKTPEMAAKLGEMGFEIYDLGPDELGELMRADLPRLTRIVALSGIAR